MKIYIEGTPLFSSTRSGVGQYTKRLTDAMLVLQPRNKYVIFGFHFFTKGRKAPSHDLTDGFERKYVRWLPGRGYNLLYKKGIRLPVDILLRSRPDVVFYGNFAHWPLWTNAKSVIVIHDLAFLDTPQYVEEKNRHFLEKYVPYSVQKSDHIFTVSEYSKRRIIEEYAASPDKVTVVYPAVDHGDYYPRSNEEVALLRKEFKLPENYLLFVSTLEPRKNVCGLLDAYADLPAETQKKYPLVLVGGKGWADEEIHERLRKYSHLPIIRPGYIEDKYMAALYTGATALVFPTHYEGFGMPPLEAMACGTPVITSNSTSLPEVVGEAALLVDPGSRESIVAAMKQVIDDPRLRETLTKKGIIQSQKFDWMISAKKALEVFESIT